MDSTFLPRQAVLEALQRHYDSINLAKRAAEAMPRRYGKREEDEVVSALDFAEKKREKPC